jgi:hypothetical protein
MTTTVDTLVPGTLWQAIQPLLPTPPRRYGGRPRINDRAALVGIVYQLRTAASGGYSPLVSSAAAAPSPAGRGCATGNASGSGSVCTQVLLDQLGRDGKLDWSRASLDSISVRTRRGELTGPNPTDRGKSGSNYYLLVDRRGIPLAGVPVCCQYP